MTRNSDQSAVLPEADAVSHIELPLAWYSKTAIRSGFRRLMAQRLGAALRGWESRVERLSVRFEDLNGPKGGVDTACRIQVTLSAQPIVVVEGRGETAPQAFRLALRRLGAAIDRQFDRRSARPRTSLRLALVRAG